MDNYDSDEIYCIIATFAHPDYKRPGASFIVHHCKTEEQAKKIAQDIFNDWINDRGYKLMEGADAVGIDDYTSRVYVLVDPDDPTDNDAVSLEDIIDDYYADSYMDMPPIDIEIKKVSLVDENLTPIPASSPKRKKVKD